MKWRWKEMFHAPVLSTIVNSGVQSLIRWILGLRWGRLEGKTASLFLSLPHTCYSSPVFCRLILMYVEILICFNMETAGEMCSWLRHHLHHRLQENVQWDMVQTLTAASWCFHAGIQHLTAISTEAATKYWSCDSFGFILIDVYTDRRH